MEDTIIPYELPEVENHSFFFIDQRIETSIEAKLHQHDAWELYYVVHGYGTRMSGDTLQPFAAGDVALIPPSMFHRWEYSPDSADDDGCVRYLMVAFSHSLVERCMAVFPELRNRLTNHYIPDERTEIRYWKFTNHSPDIVTDERYGRIGTPMRNVSSATCHIYLIRPYPCRKAHEY